MFQQSAFQEYNVGIMRNGDIGISCFDGGIGEAGQAGEKEEQREEEGPETASSDWRVAVGGWRGDWGLEIGDG